MGIKEVGYKYMWQKKYRKSYIGVEKKFIKTVKKPIINHLKKSYSIFLTYRIHFCVFLAETAHF